MLSFYRIELSGITHPARERRVGVGRCGSLFHPHFFSVVCLFHIHGDGGRGDTVAGHRLIAQTGFHLLRHIELSGGSRGVGDGHGAVVVGPSVGNGAGDTVGDADQRITFELAVCRGFSARLLQHCFFDFKRRREF
jgi:hypothetical protein